MSLEEPPDPLKSMTCGCGCQSTPQSPSFRLMLQTLRFASLSTIAPFWRLDDPAACSHRRCVCSNDLTAGCVLCGHIWALNTYEAKQILKGVEDRAHIASEAVFSASELAHMVEARSRYQKGQISS